MCLPAIAPAVLMWTSLATTAASTAVGYMGQRAQYEAQKQSNAANYSAAVAAMTNDLAMMETRQIQEADASGQKVFEARKEALRQRGQLMASSGNVSGVSVGQLLQDYGAQEGQYIDSVRQNLGTRLTQLDAEKTSIRSTAAQRVAGLPTAVSPSILGAGLGFAGSAMSTISTFQMNDPNNKYYRRNL